MKLNVNIAELRLSAGAVAQFPRDAKNQIAFSGRSNVGKSSLINTLLGRKSFAHVSSAPGKTVTINFYEIDRKAYFVDLPGYGYAKRSFDKKQAFSELTDAYFTKNPSADKLKLVLQLFDVRTGPTEDDVMMINYLLQSGIPFCLVATKTDKLSKTALRETLEQIKQEYFSGTEIPIFPFSSVTREGKEQILGAISAALA